MGALHNSVYIMSRINPIFVRQAKIMLLTQVLPEAAAPPFVLEKNPKLSVFCLARDHFSTYFLWGSKVLAYEG